MHENVKENDQRPLVIFLHVFMHSLFHAVIDTFGASLGFPSQVCSYRDRHQHQKDYDASDDVHEYLSTCYECQNPFQYLRFELEGPGGDVGSWIISMYIT